VPELRDHEPASVLGAAAPARVTPTASAGDPRSRLGLQLQRLGISAMVTIISAAMWTALIGTGREAHDAPRPSSAAVLAEPAPEGTALERGEPAQRAPEPARPLPASARPPSLEEAFRRQALPVPAARALPDVAGGGPREHSPAARTARASAPRRGSPHDARSTRRGAWPLRPNPY